jgi:hypothetical protein
MTSPTFRYHGGIRFQNVSVPPSAVIVNARLSFHTYSSSYDNAYFTLYGHDTGNAGDFATNPIIKGRSYTDASLTWGQSGLAADWHDSDVTSIVQEIVNRGDWGSGNAMAFLFIGRTDITNQVNFYSADFDNSPGPSLAPKLYIDYTFVTNIYRSVGTNPGSLYSAGTASIDNGSTTVTFSGGSLPEPDVVGAVGPGDKLVLGSETFYIKSRDSATQVTVQTAATGDRSGTPDITRAYNTISAWESAREAANPDLTSSETIEVAVCYKDGPMNEKVIIGGFTTGPNNYIKIWVPPGQRHTGTAGTGFVLKYNYSGSTGQRLFQIDDKYVRVEGIEIDGSQVDAPFVYGFQARPAEVTLSDIRFDKVLVHDLTANTTDDQYGARGIDFRDGSSGPGRVTNSIIYNIKSTNPNALATGAGIRLRSGSTVDLYNNTIYNVSNTGSSAAVYGIWAESGTITAINNYVGGTSCSSCGTDNYDFYGSFESPESDYNISEDSTAPGAGSLTDRLPYDDSPACPGANQCVIFQNIDAATEDLHLRNDVNNDALDAGDDLSGAFTDDIDGEVRPTGANTWDIGADEYVVPITTLGDGSDPGDTVIAPGATATELDSFTLQTNTGADTVTQATVTLAAGTSARISLVEITSGDGLTVYGSASDPAGDAVSISSMSIPVNTTLTQFKVRITPESHTNMPAPAGSTYSVTGTITSFTSTNSQAGTDTDSATVTIDNLSPGNVTGASATPGDTQATISWTNPGDADFSNLVVLRSTSTIADVPVEGSSPALNTTIGASVVRYISSGTSFIDTGLTSGQIYYYRIFAKDTSGNYSATGVEVYTWYNTDWQYRKHLRIDSSRVAGDLSYFPVLISTTDADWMEDDSYGGHVAQTDGGDMLFTASDGTTKLDHEIEKYDPATGELIAWVKVPALSGSTDTSIYIYYGNTSLAEAVNQWNAAGVWANGYVGVWHLHDDFNDSTSEGNNGTNSGSDDDTGQMANGQNFVNADDDDIYTGTNSTMADASAVTISAWIKPDASQTRWAGILDYRVDASGWETVLEMKETGKFSFGVWTDTYRNLESNAVVPTTGFSHIVGVYDGSNQKTYIGGQLDNTQENATGNLRDNSRPFHIGRNPGDAVTFNGVIDEVRISNIPRSQDWIETEYNNQKAPAAFYTVGIEETSGAGADPFNNNWSYRKRITIDSAKVDCDLTNFAVLIKTTDADLTQAQVDFNDILFTAADGSTKLDHEIEKYNSSTGEIVAWVEVPSVSSTTNTDIYIYYANGTAVDQRNPTGAGVWEPNYVSVHHLKETPTVDAFAYDSTSNDNDATFLADMTFGDQVDGRIDGALDFDASSTNDRVITNDNPSLGNMSDLTVETWVQLKEYPPTNSYYMSYKEHSVAPWFSWQFMVTDWGDPFYLEVRTTDGNYGSCASSTVPNTTDWYHVVGVYEHNQPLRIYVNGVEDTAWSNQTPTGNIMDSDGNLSIGWDVKGIQDEFRVSKVARDACWIGTEYNNQSNPDGFYTIGIEEQNDTDGDPLQNGWTYRKRLTIDASRVAGDLTNFPVLISTTDEDWMEDDSYGGHVAQTDGGDILFTASDGITKLDHEIERYDETTGELVAWVEVRSLSGTNNTDIYIYYGNTSLAEAANQWNTMGVWDSNFREVFHLHEPSGTLNDSTASGYTGTAGATVVQGATGKIAKAVEFDGTENSHVTLSDGIMAKDQKFTFSAWVKADTLPPVEWQAIVHKGRDSNDDWQGLWVYDGGHLTFGWEADGGGGNVDGSILSTDQWYYVVGTYDGTNRRLYLNGALDGGPDPSVSHDTDIEEPTQIGEDYDNGKALDGIVDEVRISNIARPPEWIQTEYNNQRAPAAFYTVGIEETDGTGADPFDNGWQYSKKITILASEVAADLTNFPVLIRATYPEWADTSNDGLVAQSDGGDILFIAGDRTTKLDHEIESYNEITGELVAWVEVRSLSDSEDTDIYIFYGNADAVDQWNPTGAGVWEPNYVGVWHMEETPADGGTHFDSMEQMTSLGMRII